MLRQYFQHVSTKETKCIRHSAIIIDGYIHKSTEENKPVNVWLHMPTNKTPPRHNTTIESLDVLFHLKTNQSHSFKWGKGRVGYLSHNSKMPVQKLQIIDNCNDTIIMCCWTRTLPHKSSS